MKKLIIFLVAAIVSFSIVGNAFAGNYTVTSIGNFDYVSGSDGYYGTGTQIGSFYYYNDNR